MTGQWFSPGTPASFTNETDRHDITEILLKVVIDTINQTFYISLSLTSGTFLVSMLLC